jgi:glycosyltransferase involved in cell wall biosynthesis
MRILLVNKYARVTGGADKHCLDLYRLLTATGHEVRLLSTADPRNEGVRGAFVGRTVSNATRGQLPVRQRAAVFSKALWNPVAARAMKRLLQDFAPDIIHSHKLYPQLSVSPLWTAHRAGIPVIHTLHDYEMMAANAFDSGGHWMDATEARWDFRLLNTSTLPVRRTLHRRVVTSWIAVSRFLAEAHGQFGVEPHVIPNFVDPQPAPIPFEKRSGIAFVGRLSPEKGAGHVVRLARRSPDIGVNLAGDGDMMPEIVQAAKALPNLRVQGRLDEHRVAALLGSSRVVVMPSLWDEPGPLVALEAMAAGTPVVAYRRGGLAEYVSDAGSGAVVTSFEDLSRHARRLHSDPASWHAASASGIRAATTVHSPHAYVERLTDVYRRVATGSARVTARV